MAIDVNKLLRALGAKNYALARQQLDAWTGGNFAHTDLEAGLQSIESTEERGRVAGALARAAADSGRPSLVNALAAIQDRAVLDSLSAPLDDGHTPASIAAFYGHAESITALAATGDKAIQASLAAEHPLDGRTPAFRAAANGHADAIEALAATEDPAVLASLAASHPVDGLTLEAQARRGYADAAARDDPVDMRRYRTTVNVLRDAVAIPADEQRLVQKARADLDSQRGADAAALLADLRCPVSYEPFTTAGSSRPVHLTLNGELQPQQCVSKRSRDDLFLRDIQINPETRARFDGFVEAKERQTLVRDVIDAYRQNPNDVEAARRGALNAHAEYEMKVVVAAPRAELSRNATDARALLEAAETTDRRELGVHYQDILARLAGAGAVPIAVPGAIPDARARSGAGASS